MDDRPSTYTMDELERFSGFDRRTIAYYVQEGLLPRIGRRGPRTRYPRLFLDRLLFIRRIRDLEDEGRTESMTLSDIRLVLEELPEEELADVATGREALRVADMRPPPAIERDRPAGNIDNTLEAARMKKIPRAMASPGLRARMMDRLMVSEPMTSADRDYEETPDEREDQSLELGFLEPISQEPDPLPHRLGDLLARLSTLTGVRGRRWGRGSEHWTRANITRDITISARNLDEDEADLLEEAARILRRMMRDDG